MIAAEPVWICSPVLTRWQRHVYSPSSGQQAGPGTVEQQGGSVTCRGGRWERAKGGNFVDLTRLALQLHGHVQVPGAEKTVAVQWTEIRTEPSRSQWQQEQQLVAGRVSRKHEGVAERGQSKVASTNTEPGGRRCSSGLHLQQGRTEQRETGPCCQTCHGRVRVFPIGAWWARQLATRRV